MKTVPLILALIFTLVLTGNNQLWAADKGRNQGESQWYADPQRGWIRSDERRDRDERRDHKNERRENPKDRRSNPKDRDKGKGRGGWDY